MATQSVRTRAIASRASSVASRGRDPRVDRRCVSCSHGKNPSHWNRELMSIELTSPPPSTFALQVQTFGRKKTAVAVVHCKAGKGLIRFNGACLSRERARCWRRCAKDF